MQQSVSSVSVVIPHYGDRGPTALLVGQLALEPGVLEIIVVDDCSPEPVGEIDGATVVRRTSNGGFGSTVNTGAAVARGDLLLILNSDVAIEPGFVPRLVGAARPWQPAVVAPAVRTGGRLEHTARRFPRARHLAFERVRLLTRFHQTGWWGRAAGQDLRARPGADREVDWIAGVCLMVPRAAFERVGGFDERFFMYAEEVDLQRRLATEGVRRVYLGSLEVDHLGGASSDPARAQGWLAQSRATYAAKWGGLPSLRALLSAVAVVNAGTDAVRRLAGRDTHPVAELRREVREAWTAPQRAR